MPKPIQSGDGVRLAQRYGIVGRLPLTLDEVVVPVSLIDDGSRFSQYERRDAGAVVVSTTAGPAQFSTAQIQSNGDGSTIIQVDRVWVSTPEASPGNAFLQIFRQLPGTGSQAGGWRDIRLGGFPSAFVAAANVAAAEPGIPLALLEPGPGGVQVTPDDLRIVLDPNPDDVGNTWALQVVSSFLQTQLIATFWWQELVPRRP